jgi:hypothetical protein
MQTLMTKKKEMEAQNHVYLEKAREKKRRERISRQIMVQEETRFLSSVSQAGSEYGGDRSPNQKMPTSKLKDALAYSEHTDQKNAL